MGMRQRASLHLILFIWNAYLHTPVAGEPVSGADLSELASEIPEKLREVFLPFVPALRKGGLIDTQSSKRGSGCKRVFRVFLVE